MKSKNIKEFEEVAKVVADLRSEGFTLCANISLLEKDEIRVQIVGNNDRSIERLTTVKLTGQTKAFHQATTDLQGVGLWVATSLTTSYNNRLDISITADNIPKSGDNINTQCLAPMNNGIPGPARIWEPVIPT